MHIEVCCVVWGKPKRNNFGRNSGEDTMNRLRKMNLSKGKMLVATLVFALIAMSFVACGQAPAASGIAITGMPEGNKIAITDTVTTHKLGFALSPQNAKSDVTWSSSDQTVAKVNADGLLTLCGEGVTVITVSLKDNAQIKAEEVLSVLDKRTPTATIEIAGLAQEKVALSTREIQLSATCSDENATIEWLSSNEGIAAVNESGLVTFRTAGTVKITAYKQGESVVRSAITIHIVNPVQSLTIEGVASGDVLTGYEYTLATSHTPADADTFAIEWSVNNNTVADIDADGKLVGKANGDVTVTAKIKDSNVTATKQYKVVALDKNSENFKYAQIGDSTVIGDHTYYSLDYSSSRVTSEYLEFSFKDYGDNQRALVAEKTGKNYYWTDLSLGDWSLEKGDYELTLDMDVEGKPSGHIFLSTYRQNKIEKTNDKVLDKLLADHKVSNENKYVVPFCVSGDKENVCITIGSNYGSDATSPESKDCAYKYTVRSFALRKLPEIESVAIEGGATLDTGKNMSLTEKISYAGGADKGQGYTCEWSVAGKGDKPGDAEIEGSKLIALRPGTVTVTCKVTSNTGKVLSVTKDITINLGELAVSIDNGYGDNVLVAGKEYPISVTKFDESCEIQYAYSVADVIKVENDKISALKAGDVTLTVSTSYGGQSVKKEIGLTVLDFSKTEDKNYTYAKYTEANNKHGDWFDVDRTAVYTRAFNMNIAVEGNSLKFTKNWVPADGTSVLFMLGDVEAGYYKVTFGLRGNLDWSSFRGYLYAINWKDGFMETYNDTAYTQAADPYGNIHEAHVFSYSGASSTAGGTYTTYINLATAQKNFGLALKTWEEANKSYSIYLDGMSFEKVDYPQSYDFENTNRVCANAAGYSHIIVGDNGGGIWCKGTNSANIIESNGGKALEIVIPDTDWAEVSFRLGKVKAGTYTVSFDLQKTDGNGLNHYALGKFDAKNNRSEIGTFIGLNTVTPQGNTYTIEITLAEDVDEFAFVLATNARYGKVVLDNFTFAPKAA